MKPLLNYTPQLYEAIIAAFVVLNLIQAWVLRRRRRQAETLKSALMGVITEATKAVVATATFGSLRVANARAETKRILKALVNADSRVQELEAEVAALESDAGDTPDRGPTIKAFRITPRGLEPVDGPQDFFSGGTFNRPTPDDFRQPSLAEILSLLAASTRPSTGQWAGPAADSVKTDLGTILHDEFGPAAPGDDRPTTINEEGHGFVHEPHSPAAAQASGADEALRMPRYNYEDRAGPTGPTGASGVPPAARSVPRYASDLPRDMPGLGLPSSPRAG